MPWPISHRPPTQPTAQPLTVRAQPSQENVMIIQTPPELVEEENPTQPRQILMKNSFPCPAAHTVVGFEQNGGFWHAIETRCNRWHCPGCGRLKTWNLCRRIEAAEPNRFVTLTTARPKDQTPREVWNTSRRQVSELAKRLRKIYGSFEYCRVLEEHKSGFPHFHLVVRSPFIEQTELSRHWCELTDAFIVDIRKIDPKRKVARYIAKYLSKTPTLSLTNRRVTNSRNFWKKEEKDDHEPLTLEQISRYRGNFERVRYWEFPNADIEQLTACHWILNTHTLLNDEF